MDAVFFSVSFHNVQIYGSKNFNQSKSYAESHEYLILGKVYSTLFALVIIFYQYLNYAKFTYADIASIKIVRFFITFQLDLSMLLVVIE